MKPSLLLAAIITGLALACSGGGGNDPGAQPTATLAPPPLDPNLNAVGRGDLVLAVEPHARQQIDPLAIARANGTPPACADFVFLFTWRVRSGPPLKFVVSRQGGTDNVANGANGGASISGCTLLEAVNDGDAAVAGDLRYFIA
ncbi:MAG TPA: hypothetical protein VI759_09450, partial [Dehalococcoidia bacterium]|nr:hypothetical protein [Dehalococcoidia bacterium]